MLFIALITQCMLMLLTTRVFGKIHQHTFTVTEKLIAPDNYGHNSIVINDQFPAPTLNVQVGDTIEIKVINKLNKPFSIHWHGMVQKGSAKSDGVPNVTQLPIAKGMSYDYKFNVGDQAGTWWYHAHTGLDSEQAFGALIVQETQETKNSLIKYNPKYKYDDELTILLSEWWHSNPDDLVKGLTSMPWKFVGRPDSILNNGRTYSEWGTKDNSSLPFNEGYPVLKVKKGLTYRLRLIGSNGLSFLSFKIPNHKMTLIEGDGTFLEPVEVDRVEINAGERYSVLVTFDQEINNYFSHTQVISSDLSPTNGFTIFHYEGANDPAQIQRKLKSSNDLTATGPLTRFMEAKVHTSNWYKIRDTKLPIHYYNVPINITKEIIINSMGSTDSKGMSVMTINDRINVPRNGVTLDRASKGLVTIDNVKEGIYDINEGDKVQLIVQLWGLPNRTCAPHPWHLHGHSFHIVGQGNDYFKSEVDNQIINQDLLLGTSLPRFKDTFTHYTSSISQTEGLDYDDSVQSDTLGVTLDMSTNLMDEALKPIGKGRAAVDKAPCGWYAIRFVADNPGSWFMHCHIGAHLVMGKQLVINELPAYAKVV